MEIKNRQLVIIGAGPAGMAAALSAKKQGVSDILILERSSKPGGILPQCIHTGFGLLNFGEELTGPEYATKFWRDVKKENIEVKLNTMVTDISPEKIITAMSGEEGLLRISAGAVILAIDRKSTRLNSSH